MRVKRGTKEVFTFRINTENGVHRKLAFVTEQFVQEGREAWAPKQFVREAGGRGPRNSLRGWTSDVTGRGARDVTTRQLHLATERRRNPNRDGRKEGQTVNRQGRRIGTGMRRQEAAGGPHTRRFSLASHQI